MSKKFTATFVNSLKAVSDNAKRKRMEYWEKIYSSDTFPQETSGNFSNNTRNMMNRR